MSHSGFVASGLISGKRFSAHDFKQSSAITSETRKARALGVRRRAAPVPCLCMTSDKGSQPYDKNSPPNEAEATREEWEALIWEFENRNAENSLPEAGEPATYGKMPVRPEGRPLGRQNPEQFAVRNLVECGAMTAATAYMWFLGRILRLDAFIVLFYPLPSLFIMMRWGPSYGNCMPLTTTIFITTMLGPLYGVLFALNSGLLIVALGNSLWYQWHWSLSLLAALAAKFVGFFLNVAWTSAMLQHDTWKLVGDQAKHLIDSAGNAICRVLGGGRSFNAPTILQVRIGIAFILFLHSLIHVLCTHLSATMILDRLYDQRKTARPPRLVPFLRWVKSRAVRHYDSLSSPIVPGNYDKTRG